MSGDGCDNPLPCVICFQKKQTRSGKWAPWMSADVQVEIPPGTKFSQIMVPTVDTARYTFLLDLLIRQNRHVLLVGPTGMIEYFFVR